MVHLLIPPFFSVVQFENPEIRQVGLCHGLVAPGMGVFSAPLALSRSDRRRNMCCRWQNRWQKGVVLWNPFDVHS